MSLLFGKVCQNGYVVRDIEQAMKFWIDVMRVGPFFYIPRVKTDWFRYRGVDSAVEMSIALANSGDLQIELIQQRNDAPSMYRDFLAAGREGLQHVAYWTNDFEADLQRCLDQGLVVGQQGVAGGANGRFVYFDTEAHPGTVVELSDSSGAKGAFFKHIADVARVWDGKAPIRRL